MANHWYLTRTIHMPVTSDGRKIRNSFGVEIATCNDESTAEAMAILINMAYPLAKLVDDERDEKESRIADMFRKSKGNR